MKRSRKLLAVTLACLIISFPVINVSATEVPTLVEMPISITTSCTHKSKFVINLTPSVTMSSHQYQPSPNVAPVTCTIITTIYSYYEYCYDCKISLGTVYYSSDSHSAH